MDQNKLLEQIVDSFISTNGPDSIIESKLNYDCPYIVIDNQSWNRMTALLLRDDEALQFEYLSCVSGVDYPEEQMMEVVYMLYSITLNQNAVIKVRIPRDNPRIMSVKELWNSADYHEREAYDLLGIHFEGHPNLTRILLEDDWEGYPLRKDYEVDKAKLGLE
ncbi:NADH-quinone oxidoreductase subunit C [Desulfuribacillus alkaliarsenatis]|uniref:NAD(P)H dehydrogenase subunit J n=1 Tax=Desulfuribacillus alkaliarsenatis TaxID=766136 RepID=A0A1E5G1S5_9FIRM|nr:NADH-quinone oxidoreductase subunit C [Desulfuribacillus alkaliarsenatis]OEF96782.1 hypothetical protein BHF68_06875 [Desulfuribacillus alkaliarsenatis]